MYFVYEIADYDETWNELKGKFNTYEEARSFAKDVVSDEDRFYGMRPIIRADNEEINEILKDLEL